MMYDMISYVFDLIIDLMSYLSQVRTYQKQNIYLEQVSRQCDRVIIMRLFLELTLFEESTRRHLHLDCVLCTLTGMDI